MRRFALLLLAVAAPAAAQIAIYEPGYVEVDGRRVAGGVALGSDLDNARSVRFRAGQAGTPETFGPAEVEGYGTEAGLRFRAGRYPVGADTLVAFARLLRDGRADLLALTTEAGVRYFAVLDQRPPVPLLEPADGPDYRQTLAGLFTDCPGRTADVAFTADALGDAIDRFNRCVDRGYDPDRDPTEPVVRRPPTEAAIEVGLGAFGGQLTQDALTTDTPAGVSAPVARVVGTVRPSRFRWLQLVAEGSYAHDVARLWISTFNGQEIAVDAAQAGAGVRVAFGDGVTVGGGGVIGRNWRRVTNGAYPLPEAVADGSVTTILSYTITRSLGWYAEATVAVPGRPLTFALRGQRVALSGTNGGFSTGPSRAAILSLGAEARWRFGL